MNQFRQRARRETRRQVELETRQALDGDHRPGRYGGRWVRHLDLAAALQGRLGPSMAPEPVAEAGRGDLMLTDKLTGREALAIEGGQQGLDLGWGFGAPAVWWGSP